MKPIKQVKFGGIAPSCNPVQLPDTMGQVAANCYFKKRDLRPLKNTVPIVTPPALGAAIRSIYRIGQTLPETQYWMAWTSDVDVCKGPVAGDVSERTFFTGNGAPKVTTLQLATQNGTRYPVNSFTLGIPAPLDPMLATATNAAAPVQTRVYVCTYVSALGEEGRPSPPRIVTTNETGTVNLTNIPTGPSGNYNITHKRIYRAQQTGTGQAIYLFVAEIPLGQTTYTDNVAGTALGEPISTLDYDTPPATMQGLINMQNGMMAGFDKNEILFCEPFLPYAWPIGYRQTANSPIVGLGTFGNSLLVLTTGKPHLLTGVHPEGMFMEEVELTQPCVSKRSICSIGGAVLYASNEGIVKIGGGPATVITEQIYTPEDWQATNPDTLQCFYVGNQYIGFYGNGGGFIMDLSPDGSFTTFTDHITGGFVDPTMQALYVVKAGVIHKWDAGTDRSYVWRSKKYPFFGSYFPTVARVDANHYPLVLNIYADGILRHSSQVESSASFKLTAYDNRVDEIEFELVGNAPVKFVGISDSVLDFAHG